MELYDFFRFVLRGNVAEAEARGWYVASFRGAPELGRYRRAELSAGRIYRLTD
jgi:hypothetical protein